MLMPSIFGESIFNGFFDDFGTMWPERRSSVRSTAMPVMKTDVKETETGYELDIDLPGYSKDQISAELKDGYLTISAKKETDSAKNASENAEDASAEAKPEDSGRYIRRERYFGSCSRSYFVGKDLELEDIKARFENGILKVSVPKKEAKPKIEENRFVTIEG